MMQTRLTVTAKQLQNGNCMHVVMIVPVNLQLTSSKH